MNGILSAFRQHIRRMRVAYLVLALLAAPVDGGLFLESGRNVETREQTRFRREVQVERAAIEQRISHYSDEMTGLRGLFAASASVTDDQWQAYLAATQPQRLLPGLRTLGYLEQVSEIKRRGLSQTPARLQPGAKILKPTRRGPFVSFP